MFEVRKFYHSIRHPLADPAGSGRIVDVGYRLLSNSSTASGSSDSGGTIGPSFMQLGRQDYYFVLEEGG